MRRLTLRLIIAITVLAAEGGATAPLAAQVTAGTPGAAAAASSSITPAGGSWLRRETVLSPAAQPQKPQVGLRSQSDEGSGLTKYFHKSAQAIKDIFTIEPKVVPAADQTNLAYDPGPLRPQLYASSAALLEQKGDLDRAADQYQHALELDKNYRPALIGLARLYHRAGRIDESIAIYRRALMAYPRDPVILNDLALCLARGQRRTEAVQVLRQAVSLQPNSTLYRNNLAAVLVEDQQPDAAARELVPVYGEAIALYNVGYLLAQRGQADLASRYFAQALQVKPDLYQARVMLDRLAPRVGRQPPAGYPAISPAQGTPPARSTYPQPSAPFQSGQSQPGPAPGVAYAPARSGDLRRAPSSQLRPAPVVAYAPVVPSTRLSSPGPTAQPSGAQPAPQHRPASTHTPGMPAQPSPLAPLSAEPRQHLAPVVTRAQLSKQARVAPLSARSDGLAPLAVGHPKAPNSAVRPATYNAPVARANGSQPEAHAGWIEPAAHARPGYQHAAAVTRPDSADDTEHASSNPPVRVRQPESIPKAALSLPAPEPPNLDGRLRPD